MHKFMMHDGSMMEYTYLLLTGILAIYMLNSRVPLVCITPVLQVLLTTFCMLTRDNVSVYSLTTKSFMISYTMPISQLVGNH